MVPDGNVGWGGALRWWLFARPCDGERFLRTGSSVLRGTTGRISAIFSMFIVKLEDAVKVRVETGMASKSN